MYCKLQYHHFRYFKGFYILKYFFFSLKIYLFKGVKMKNLVFHNWKVRRFYCELLIIIVSQKIGSNSRVTVVPPAVMRVKQSRVRSKLGWPLSHALRKVDFATQLIKAMWPSISLSTIPEQQIHGAPLREDRSLGEQKNCASFSDKRIGTCNFSCSRKLNFAEEKRAAGFLSTAI